MIASVLFQNIPELLLSVELITLLLIIIIILMVYNFHYFYQDEMD